MKKMESGKVVSPDNIPGEVWKCLGEKKVGCQTTCQTKQFDKFLENQRECLRNGEE